MNGLGGTAFALLTAALGTVLAAAGSVFAAANNTTDFTPWVSGGGAAAAVGGLVYIAKKLADGSLVAYPVADLHRQSDERERQLHELVDDSRQREDSLRLLILQQRGQR